MFAIRIIMPSEGDMELVRQQGGEIVLSPIFYGSECAGPHVQLVELDTNVKEGDRPTVGKVLERYRMRIKTDGKLELKRGHTRAEEEKDEN